MDISSPLAQEEEMQELEGKRDSTVPGEHHYDNYYEYCLSLIGFAVGLGSFWRFPYLVYKNGGGAFLIPYFFAMLVIGMPLLYLETAVGQIFQCSLPKIFSKINRGLKFVGVSFVMVCFHFAGFYNIILTYTFRFLFSAFLSPLPFEKEPPEENTYMEK